MQRAEPLAVIGQLAQAVGFAAGTVGIDEHPGVDVVFELLDPGEAMLDQVDRLELARRSICAGLGDGGEFSHHHE